MKNKFLLLCAASILLTTACSQKIIGPTATVNITGGSGKIYSPDEVTITETLYSFNDKEYLNYQVLPSTGTVNLLVVPVIVPGYETIDLDGDSNDDKDQVKSDIETAFFSTDNDQVSHRSVKNFYLESSYNKLNLAGEVTSWFNLSSIGYTSASEITFANMSEIVNGVTTFLKNNGYNLLDYDSDDDGYIDGIWLVYSAPNYTNGGPKLNDNNFWAYTSWANRTVEGDVTNPVANLFGWASYDFLYEGYEGEVDKINAQTFIHETGHFLGLEDYYGESGYNPLGGVDMMDANIIDHNSYSKMLLGWTKPYLVYGSGRISLHTMENENSLIVIPDDSAIDENGNFNPFSEYILVELYANVGLNYQDSRHALEENGGSIAPNGYGLRIYHVDKRIFYVDASSNEWTIELYDGQTLDENSGLATPITNSRARDTYEIYFGLDSTVLLLDELRLIEASNSDTFSSGGYQSLKSYFDVGQTFSMTKYGTTFFNNGLFNNGNTFSKTISLEAIIDEN